MNTEDYVFLGYVILIIVCLLLARIPGFVGNFVGRFNRSDYMLACVLWPFALAFLLCVGLGMAIAWPLEKLANILMGPKK